MEKPVYIYKLIDPRTKQIRYIGKTVRKPTHRLSSHITEASKRKSKSHKNSWIIQLLNINMKPIIEVVEICTSKNWCEREKYWISYYENLTNMSIGGEHGSLGIKQSKEVIEKRMKTIRKKIASGEIDYTERAEKMSIRRKGAVVKNSTKEKLRQINLGKTYSLETRLKKSKGGVLQYDLNDNLIGEYLTLTEASEKTGFYRGNISSACTGRFKQYKGYVWKYKK